MKKKNLNNQKRSEDQRSDANRYGTPSIGIYKKHSYTSGTGPRGQGTARDNHPTTKNDPRYHDAYRTCELRRRYPSEMPKERTEKEKDLFRSLSKEDRIAKTAEGIVNDYMYDNDVLDDDSFAKTDAKYQRALDAARRHVRRHPNQYKESAGIFSSINFI